MIANVLNQIPSQKLKDWIKKTVDLCGPSSVWLCDGTEEEYSLLCRKLVESGTFRALNQNKHPDSFLALSSPQDVARVESKTFICSQRKEDAGPTNNWCEPDLMLQRLYTLFKGCMKGRTLYIIPYSMGPIGSDIARIGVQITDSPYVVCNMRIMTRIGSEVLKILENHDFVAGLHSVGKPIDSSGEDVPWPCNPEETVIAHFPETKSIWSFGSGYGGNALLGKKCFALRIGSVMGRDEGWLAEHMLILGITNPQGKKKYFAAAFPSACGKTNLAMMNSRLPGWKIECVGDDIAWMKFGSDGRLYAINPEAGFFGVAPGTSKESNPNALSTCAKNSIFTNVALTDDGDVWWEGLTNQSPEHLTSWLNESWTPASGKKAAHPNSRFTAPARQCPVIDPFWEGPRGVPISAIIFGGRRSSTVPLIYEAFSWQHGTFLGASLSSETTAAAVGEVGKLRHDPFAMLPFCGYHMGDYFAHWLDMGKKTAPHNLPRIYAVNWFLKDARGCYIWPGFGDNIRVLKWIFERTEGEDKEQNNALQTPIGNIPKKEVFDISGLNLKLGDLDQLFTVDPKKWREDLQELRSYFALFGDRFPKGLQEELNHLESRLKL